MSPDITFALWYIAQATGKAAPATAFPAKEPTTIMECIETANRKNQIQQSRNAFPEYWYFCKVDKQ